MGDKKMTFVDLNGIKAAPDEKRLDSGKIREAELS